MAPSQIVGAILAGGRGVRMAHFADRHPKPLLPILNRPLMVHQIERLSAAHIDEIFVVVGHLGYEIARVLGDGAAYGVRLHYVEQAETLGIAHAVGQLERHIAAPFMLVLGDIYFVTPGLSAMVDQFTAGGYHGVLAVKEEPDEDAIRRNFAVIQNDDGTVRRVIEKPRYVANRLKGCGLYLFDLPIFDAIRRTPRTAMRDEYEITDSIQILINDDYRVGVAPVIDDDLNLTVPRDVWLCNLNLLRNKGLDRLVADSAKVHPGATIEESILGEDVVVSQPVRIERSVIFDRCEIRRDVSDAIVTPETFVDCSYDRQRRGG